MTWIIKKKNYVVCCVFPHVVNIWIMALFKIREDHWLVMIEFMEKNKEFACGRFSTANGREHFRKLWKELTTKLNSLGYGERPVEKWQKSWADYKSNLKKKASQIKKLQGQTGGGPELNKKLTDLELRVLNIIGTSMFEGCGNKELGLEHLDGNGSTEKFETDQDNSPKGFVLDNARGEAYYTSCLKEQPLKQANISANIEILSASKQGITEPAESTYKRPLKESSNYPSSSNKKKPSYSCEADHDYLPTPKKRRHNDTDTDMYKETINILKNIETTVDQGLNKINHTLDTHLTNICAALLKKQ